MRGLAILVGLVGLALIGLGVFYFITPANSLPVFIPGFDPTSTKIHFKHGVGSTFLGLAALAFAWFNSKGSPKQV